MLATLGLGASRSSDSALAFFALRNLWAQLELPISWTFPVLATVVLPVALLFRPPETKL